MPKLKTYVSKACDYLSISSIISVIGAYFSLQAGWIDQDLYMNILDVGLCITGSSALLTGGLYTLESNLQQKLVNTQCSITSERQNEVRKCNKRVAPTQKAKIDSPSWQQSSYQPILNQKPQNTHSTKRKVLCSS